MTNEIYNIAVTVAVLTAAFLLLVAVAKGRELYAEYSEWTTLKRRAKYRMPAYTDMERRWAIKQSRETLWTEVNRRCK